MTVPGNRLPGDNCIAARSSMAASIWLIILGCTGMQSWIEPQEVVSVMTPPASPDPGMVPDGGGHS